MKKILWIATGTLFVIILNSCGIEETVDPTVSIGLLTKSRDYLTYCLLLLNSETPYYNHFSCRYYYAMFSLAKIVSLWKHKSKIEDSELHSEVWSVNCAAPRKVYGEELKKIRTKCDYYPDVNDEQNLETKKELTPVITNDKAFSKLRKDVEKSLEEIIKRFNSFGIENSDSQKILNEIDSTRTKIADHFRSNA